MSYTSLVKSGKLTLLILFLIAKISPSFCQSPITGRVMDILTNKPIKEAWIVSSTELQTKTNYLGFFQIEADSGDYLLITAEGYQKGEIFINSTKGIKVLLKKLNSPISGTDKYHYPVIILDSLAITFKQVETENLTFDNTRISQDFCDLIGLYNYTKVFRPLKTGNFSIEIAYNPTTENIDLIDISHEKEKNQKRTTENISKKNVSTLKDKNQRERAYKIIEIFAADSSSIISLKYDVKCNINKLRDIHLLDTIKKLKSYISLEIPEYITLESNYNSIAPPNFKEQYLTYLKSYSSDPYAVQDYERFKTSVDPFLANKMIWIMNNVDGSNLTSQLQINLNVSAINLNSKNNYGLRPNKILKAKK